MSEVVVPESIVGRALDQLQQQFDVAVEPHLWNRLDQLHVQLADAKALIVRNQTQVTAELIAAAPNLQIIGRAGAGLDNIDTAAASSAGIVVTYAPRENSVSVAELTVGLLLGLARKIVAADSDTRGGGWKRREFTGCELFEKTLGVVGFGRIGTLVAERARAFGMQIVAHDEYIDPGASQLLDLDVRLLSLDDLLAQADFVSCHTPLTDETLGMFNYGRFCQMKPSALFVNAARGEVVNEEGLIRALQEQRISGAALDVRGTEPPEASPLNGMNNVILTPHIGAFTREAQERVVAAVCHDVAAVLNGESASGHFNFARPRRGLA